MLRAIVAVVLQLLLVLTLSRQAAGQAAAHLDGAQTHGHAHIRAAEGSQLALDFLTLADGSLERAFGVLVRRWGVLTCVRLHNLCAERHGQQQACDVESHWMDGIQPTMLDVQSEFLDAYPNPETHRTDSSVMRTALIFRVERAGIRRQQ